MDVEECLADTFADKWGLGQKIVALGARVFSEAGNKGMLVALRFGCVQNGGLRRCLRSLVLRGYDSRASQSVKIS